MKKLAILLLCFLLIPISFAVTLDEVIDSYNFSYQADNFNLNSLNYTTLNNSINLNLNFTGDYGNYLFVLDFYNQNLKFRYYNQSYFSLENQSINFNIPIKFEFTEYNLSLQIYLDDLIQYDNLKEINLFNFSISNQTDVNLIIFNQTLENQENDLKYLNYEKTKTSLIFNFETDLKDNYYQSFLDINNQEFYNEIKVKNNQFQIEIPIEQLLELNTNSYVINKLILKDEGKVIQSVLINQITQNYSKEDFDLDFPDLTFTYNNFTTNNQTLVNVSIINNGMMDCYGIVYEILDNNFTIIEKKRIDMILHNQSYFLQTFNQSNFYIYVDFEDEVLELNEENNIFIWPIPKTKPIEKIENKSKVQKSSSGGSSSSSSSSLNKNKDNSNEIKENNNLQKEEIKNNFTMLKENEITLENNSNEKNQSKKIIKFDNLTTEKVRDLVTNEDDSLNVGFLSFASAVFVSIFSIVFLAL